LVSTSSNARAGDVAGGANNGDRYRRIRVDNQLYQAHRLAWLYMTGEWPSNGIDHINGHRADNRWANLREATQSQNMANGRRLHQRTTNPARGETAGSAMTSLQAQAARAKYRERFPREFEHGFLSGFTGEFQRYPLGFHSWPLDRRNAWFCAWNAGNVEGEKDDQAP
jgi:hypothetical protein